MAAVTSFGGIFLRTDDPKSLYEWYERHTFGLQAIEQAVETVDLQVEHGFLCEREVGAVRLEEGEDDRVAIRRCSESASALDLGETEVTCYIVQRLPNVLGANAQDFSLEKNASRSSRSRAMGPPTWRRPIMGSFCIRRF